MIEVPESLFACMVFGLGMGACAFAWIADHLPAKPEPRDADLMVPREALKGGSHE